MRYIANAPIDYIRAGTGDLPEQLGIRLKAQGEQTEVIGGILAMISFFTALANHYGLTLGEIREKFPTGVQGSVKFS